MLQYEAGSEGNASIFPGSDVGRWDSADSLDL